MIKYFRDVELFKIFNCYGFPYIKVSADKAIRLDSYKEEIYTLKEVEVND